MLNGERITLILVTEVEDTVIEHSTLHRLDRRLH
jgi:hypothetical protein